MSDYDRKIDLKLNLKKVSLPISSSTGNMPTIRHKYTKSLNMTKAGTTKVPSLSYRNANFENDYIREGAQTDGHRFTKNNTLKYLVPNGLNDSSSRKFNKTSSKNFFSDRDGMFSSRDGMVTSDKQILNQTNKHKLTAIQCLRQSYLGEFASTKLSVDLQNNENPWLKSKAKLEHFVDNIIPHPNMISGINLEKMEKAFDEDSR